MKPTVRVACALLGLTVLATVLTWDPYPGSLAPLATFNLTFAALLVLACRAPRSYGFAALAVFLVLGFWTKFIAHIVTGARLVEATGAFRATPAQWDAALMAASAGACGVAVGRLLHLWLRTRLTGRRIASEATVAPAWFIRWRSGIWTATVVLVMAMAVANWQTGFWQIAVTKTFVLPFHLNVVFNWWFTLAAAIWVATLLELERRVSGPRHLAVWLFVPVLEAVASSVSMLSRGVYVMRLAPYFLVIAERKLRMRPLLTLKQFVRFATTVVAGLAVCLFAVSWLRLLTYPTARLPQDEMSRNRSVTPVAPPTREGPATPAERPRLSRGEAPSARQVRYTAREVGSLFVGRWIGLEGVLAATSYHARGLPLFVAALREDPDRGNESIYQTIAGKPYRTLQGFTFLTLPGTMAVLSYSGRLSIVFFGMLLVGLLVLATDEAATHLLRNEFVSAVIAVGMANAIAQTNFPYLSAVFAVELWVTIALIWFFIERPIRGEAR